MKMIYTFYPRKYGKPKADRTTKYFTITTSVGSILSCSYCRRPPRLALSQHSPSYFRWGPPLEVKPKMVHNTMSMFEWAIVRNPFTSSPKGDVEL